jgi:hypothetical protein
VLRDEPRVPLEVYDRHECRWVQLDRTPCYKVRSSVVLTSACGHFLFLATCGTGQVLLANFETAAGHVLSISGHFWPLKRTGGGQRWPVICCACWQHHSCRRTFHSWHHPLMVPSTHGTIQVPRATRVQHKVAVPVRGRRGVGPARVASSRGGVGKACTVPRTKL